ncbi:hypothetical protein GPECTOR_57g510 [Gonium pectorale]|uniref:Uncharacterized protein n=1 Tax=Gonium pectorale TaxID=33097 RepID=A0A150G7A2_GONPE|nr:hypothetical protein GPECTOR_57g510 [Gonium pectorale]|eukprot:KXZ45220.1 hypothetical protein GPECTOR_57g510 [Gonium pectorale]
MSRQLGLRHQPVRPCAAARRACVLTRALYHNLGPKDSPRVKGAQKSLNSVLELVRKGERDALVDYFATSNLTDTPTLKLASGCEVVVFEDVMEKMLLMSPSRHFLDSYAIRHLILAAPASTQVLSGLMLGPDKYVQRMAVTSPTGEEAVLTFTMTSTTPPPPSPPQAAMPEPGTAAAAVAAAAVPADQAAAPPSPSESAPPVAESEPVWRLASVRGEPAFGWGSGSGGAHPEGPSPELSPEQIVEAQLAALQRKDLAAAFGFLSPGSQKIIGDLRQFSENMARHRRYGGLLGHIAATSVRRCMARPGTYMEVVAVTSASGTRFVFCYILGREGTTGCWNIEFVKVVDDPRMLAAVEASVAAQRKGGAPGSE